MDSHILSIGGYNPSNEQSLESVEIYSVEMDTWEQAPPLNQRRCGHGSCSLADYAYVFGGDVTFSNHINTFERLNVAKLTRGEQGVAWELLSISNNQGLTPRCE